MADELDPVEQQFIADMDEYLADLEVGATEAKAFADANTEAATAVDDLRDNAAEADAEIVQLVVATNDAADATGQLRDDATEADGALDTLAASAEAAAEAEGSLRDNAAEADAALGDQRDKAAETAAATDLLAGSLDGVHDSSGKLLDDSKTLKDGLDDVKNGADDSKNSIEDLARDGSAAGSLLSGVFGAGGAVSSGFSSLTGVVEKMPTSLIAIVPAVEALLPEVLGLGSGLAAAGAGAGAFALLAMPAFKAVTTAYTQINTDQKAYDDALTKTAKNTALKKLQQDYKDLDPAERGALQGIQKLMDTYHAMAKAFEPDAFKVFNDGLKLANTLLPDIAPFANTFATALDGLLQKADKFAGSKGFKEWLSEFQKLEGPSITAIGDGIGKVAGAIGKLLTTMSAKDVVHAINIAFDILAGTISAVAFVVHTLMNNWDQLSNATDAVRESLVKAGHDIESAWDTVKHAISGDIDSMREDFVKFGHDIESDLDSMREHFVQFGHDIESAIDGARHDIASDWDAMRHDIASFADDVPKLIQQGFDNARHDAASAIDGARHDLATDYDSMRHDIASFADDVVSYFKSLPGKILAALEALPGQMLSLGENIISGLINGIENKVSELMGDISSIGSDISSFFGSILGISSPSKVFFEHGQNTLQGYIDGINATAPAVRAAMASVGGGIAAGGITGTGSAVASSSSVHVNVPISLGAGTQGYNNPAFLQYIQQTVQEATLRYTQVNPSNGLNLAGKLA